MTKAELTAENRPACKPGQRCRWRMETSETDKNQGGIEVFIVFVHVFCIVLGRLSFVHGVEIEFRIIVLDWLEVHPKGILDAISRVSGVSLLAFQ